MIAQVEHRSTSKNTHRFAVEYYDRFNNLRGSVNLEEQAESLDGAWEQVEESAREYWSEEFNEFREFEV